MGFTKKQRREQKKHLAEQKFYARKKPIHQKNESQAGRSPISGSQVGRSQTSEEPTSMFVAVRTIWITPDDQSNQDYELISVPRPTDLGWLQQQMQDKMEKRAASEHPGWKVTVEVFDADHLPEGALSEDISFRLPPKDHL